MKRLLAGGLLLALVIGTIGVATSTVTTRQGIDFRVNVREIPVYRKVVDFLHRHYQYESVARQITAGLVSDQERVLAVFDWTHRNILKTPPGWSVVDDHPLNIIIRGHGAADQMADVFTTLSTYAGVPAFWGMLAAPGSDQKLVISFARVEGRWVMFDVANDIVLRNDQGALVSVDEVAADVRVLARSVQEIRYLGLPYGRYFEGFTPPAVPAILRAEKQMPWPRLIAEMKELGRMTIVRILENR